MEETIEYCYQYNGRHLSVACGGPIYVSNYVGSMTSVPDFKASLLQEIHDLEAVLLLADDFIEDLSVDDLKVFTEEELVEMALKEEFDEFEHASGNDESLQILELASSIDDQVINFNKEIVISRVSVNGSSTLESASSVNDSSTWMCSTDVSEKKVQQKRSKKRGRHFDRNTRAAELESCYFEKVEQLAKIKQRQDEDKLAARLHSFRSFSSLTIIDFLGLPHYRRATRLRCLGGNTNSMEGAIITLDKMEKMQSLRSMTSSVKVKALTSNVHVPVYYPEVILCVEIYHQSTSKKVQEFLVLGSQNLTELRDNIYCLTDKLMQSAERYDASGYFLIEETFCNDLRSPSATDYSKPIFDWLENRRNEASEKWEFIVSGELKKKQKELLGNLDISNLPNFKAVDMHKICFCDLRFRLGAGYLYCHQGNCKHIIVFRDMRLIHPDDSHNKADYPLLTFQIKPRQRKCSVCQIYIATKMTVDDKWAPEDPCYFCIKCYFLLHYKEDNTLLYPHTVYDYFHE